MLLIFLKKAKENLAMILLKMMKVLYHKILFLLCNRFINNNIVLDKVIKKPKFYEDKNDGIVIILYMFSNMFIFFL